MELQGCILLEKSSVIHGEQGRCNSAMVRNAVASRWGGQPNASKRGLE